MIVRSRIRRIKYIIWRCMFSLRIVFWSSFVIGALLAVILHYVQISNIKAQNRPFIRRQYDFSYEKWLQNLGFQSAPRDPDIGRYNKSEPNEGPLDPSSEAYFLYERLPVFCVVFPDDFDWAKTVNDTWGRHCNRLFFFHQKLENETLAIEKLPVKSSWHLLCSALRRLSSIGGFSWIFVATQDTFVILENFRYFVAPLNASKPHYLGHGMRFWNEVYNWQDAGYALSFGAVQKLLSVFDSDKKCAEGGRYWRMGDWYLGKHLAKLGVTPRDTRDHMGRGRFNGYNMQRMLFPGGVSLFERYWKDSLYLSEDGPHCCSNFAVTFHGVPSKSKMYQLEYQYYHLRPFYGGGTVGNVPPPIEKSDPHLTWDEFKKHAGMMEFLEKQFGPTPKLDVDGAHDY